MSKMDQRTKTELSRRYNVPLTVSDLDFLLVELGRLEEQRRIAGEYAMGAATARIAARCREVRKAIGTPRNPIKELTKDDG